MSYWDTPGPYDFVTTPEDGGAINFTVCRHDGRPVCSFFSCNGYQDDWELAWDLATTPGLPAMLSGLSDTEVFRCDDGSFVLIGSHGLVAARAALSSKESQR